MRKKVFSYIKIIFLSLFTVICGCFLLTESSVVSAGIKNGLTTVGGVLIPSLFPFMFLACFMDNSGISSALGKILSPVTEFVFRLPGEASAAVLMSFVGGFPVGAKMTETLLKEEKITPSQASRMLLFCINPGPAFAVSTVGAGLLGSSRAGVNIFCSLTLSSLLIGAASGFIISGRIGKREKTVRERKCPIFEAFTKSASQATGSMLSVCSYVIVFSALCEGIKSFGLTEKINCLFFSLFEVTNGVVSSCGLFPLPVITAIIGFGGLCVHFQVMNAVVESKMKIRYFFTARLLNALLSSGICRVLLNFFPIEISVFAPGEKTLVLPFGISLPCCIAFFIMSICLIFDIAPKKKV
jgi:sporulation integral membrane protein YlbJ